jgi:hypothetical protein
MTNLIEACGVPNLIIRILVQYKRSYANKIIWCDVMLQIIIESDDTIISEFGIA